MLHFVPTTDKPGSDCTCPYSVISDFEAKMI